MIYYRPILQTDMSARPPLAPLLAGGWCWFDRLERLERGAAPRIVSVAELPDAILLRLTAPRPAVAGLAMDAPRLMGILNVTPDSFSDGGRFDAPEAALAQGRAMADAGADLIDIGGESTRPGSDAVSVQDEIARTRPIITALRASGIATPISIDTRKAEVASAALDAGAMMVNDVAALSFDPALAPVVAAREVPVCLMHAQGDPKTMQDDPRYDHVMLDVYDYLAQRVAAAEVAGIRRDRIVVDPGIGFGKTVEHNIALLRGIALFHGLGCPILLGASRKRFIGALGGGPAVAEAGLRVPGTLAVTLAAVQQGVQLHRVHDIVEANQALRLWQAVAFGGRE